MQYTQPNLKCHTDLFCLFCPVRSFLIGSKIDADRLVAVFSFVEDQMQNSGDRLSKSLE